MDLWHFGSFRKKICSASRGKCDWEDQNEMNPPWRCSRTLPGVFSCCVWHSLGMVHGIISNYPKSISRMWSVWMRQQYAKLHDKRARSRAKPIGGVELMEWDSFSISNKCLNMTAKGLLARLGEQTHQKDTEPKSSVKINWEKQISSRAWVELTTPCEC